MNTEIGKNIKRLRQAKNITQDKLAEYIGVSTPAVSKWERGETLPDIALVLPLASYFDVSTDELLGFNAAANAAEIQKRITEYYDTCSKKWDDAGKLIAAAHKEFPNDFKIMTLHAYHMIGGNADNPSETVLVHADKILPMCERILAECTDDGIRQNAIDILGKLYKARGEYDKAITMYDNFPDFYNTKNQKLEQLFTRASEEWWHYIHKNMFELTNFALDKIERVIWYSNMPTDKKEKLTGMMAEFIESMIAETGYELGYKFIASLYGEAAKHFVITKQNENACKYYELRLIYVQKFGDFMASNRAICDMPKNLKTDLQKMHNRAGLHDEIEWLENTPFLAELRKSEAFDMMLNKYRKF